MDFIEELPESEAIDTILVVVDRLSNCAHFIGLEHLYVAVSVVEKLHGVPQSMIFDRDKVFMSHF